MPRPLGLVRPFALLISLLVLSLFSVASANASDKTLRSTAIAAGKQLTRGAATLKLPDDDESPTFVADYTSGMRKLDGLLVRYGRQIATEHGSTAKGRQARKLLLTSNDELRQSYALVAKLTLGEDEPSKRDLDRAARLYDASTRDHTRGCKLLKIKLAVPLEEGSVVVSTSSDDSYDDGSDDGEDDGEYYEDGPGETAD